MKNIKKKLQSFGKFFGIAVVAFVLGISLQIARAWVTPSAEAPNANIGAPVTTGSVGQYKAGGLSVEGLMKNYTRFQSLSLSSPQIEIRAEDVDSAIQFHDPNNYWYTMGLDKSNGEKFSLNRGGQLGASDDFTLDKNGYIGIGTTSPAYRLDVVGDIRAQGGWLRTTGNTGWYSNDYEGGLYMQDSSWIRTYNSKSIWTNGGILGSNGGLTVGYGGSSPAAGGAIIAGSVGIGTMTPSEKLEVAGKIKGTELCIGGDCRAAWPASAAVDNLGNHTATGDLHMTAHAINNVSQMTVGKVYDYNNAYYVDPDSSSNLKTLCLGGTCRGDWAGTSPHTDGNCYWSAWFADWQALSYVCNDSFFVAGFQQTSYNASRESWRLRCCRM